MKALCDEMQHRELIGEVPITALFSQDVAESAGLVDGLSLIGVAYGAIYCASDGTGELVRSDLTLLKRRSPSP